MIYWVKGVFDVSCFVKYSPWNLDVVSMRELIIAVSVGNKVLAMAAYCNLAWPCSFESVNAPSEYCSGVNLVGH